MTKLSPQEDELLTKTADLVFADVHRDAPLTHLSPARQVFVRIYTAQGIIDNGSLPSFFGSDFPDTPGYSVFSDAYREIGAEDVAGWLDAQVWSADESGQGLNADAVAEDRVLGPGSDFTNNGRRIADARWMIERLLEELEVPVMEIGAGAVPQ